MDQHAGRRAYSNVLAYVARTPWAITEEAFAVVKEVLAARLAGWRPSAAEAAELEQMAAARPTSNRIGAVAVIPLQGMLVPRASTFSAMSGGTSMDTFGAAVTAAVNDPAVSHIVLDIDSPGGVSDMIPETAALLRAGAQKKPITAVANTTVGSAALWLACQCSSISASPSAYLGSLGVFAAHRDVSAALANAGMKMTLIRSAVSPYKAEGNPFEPLSPEAMAAIQEDVDRIGEAFCNDVALGRGLDPEYVAANFGQGRMLSAQEAVDVGMGDRVESLTQAISRILQAQGASHASGAYAGSTIPESDEPGIEADSLDDTSQPLVPGAEALLSRPGFRAAYSTGR